MIKNIGVILIGVLLMSMSKCNEPKTRMLKGRIMVDCGQPYANKVVHFKYTNNHPFGIGAPTWVANCMTDSKGYFKFVYKKKNAVNEMEPSCLISLPTGETNIDLGTVYTKYHTISYIRQLNVQNPHSSNDTIYLFNPNAPDSISNAEIVIPGPFQDMIIDTVWNKSVTLKKSKYELNEPFKFWFTYNVSWSANSKTCNFKKANLCSPILPVANITVE